MSLGFGVGFDVFVSWSGELGLPGLVRQGFSSPQDLLLILLELGKKVCTLLSICHS
jgi:hypothetical protein